MCKGERTERVDHAASHLQSVTKNWSLMQQVTKKWSQDQSSRTLQSQHSSPAPVRTTMLARCCGVLWRRTLRPKVPVGLRPSAAVLQAGSVPIQALPRGRCFPHVDGTQCPLHTRLSPMFMADGSVASVSPSLCNRRFCSALPSAPAFSKSEAVPEHGK